MTCIFLPHPAWFISLCSFRFYGDVAEKVFIWLAPCRAAPAKLYPSAIQTCYCDEPVSIRHVNDGLEELNYITDLPLNSFW